MIISEDDIFYYILLLVLKMTIESMILPSGQNCRKSSL